MKTLTFILCSLVCGIKLFSQVVFCPPGAEWHYLFIQNNLSPQPSFVNETITYTGDSVLANETVKVLKHARFFNEYNEMDIGQTFIKQKGDTVFMKNACTSNQWQILFNFAAMVGQSWTNSFGPINNYQITVDSIKNISVNGFNLKHLYCGPRVIAERIGNYHYLFDYSGTLSDGDYVYQFLCYRDNSFGLKQFTSKPCDYSNSVGIEEAMDPQLSLKVYPNPVQGNLNLQWLNVGSEPEFKLSDVFGRLVWAKKVNSNDSEISIDMAPIAQGIYFLSVYQNNKLIQNQKIIKILNN